MPLPLFVPLISSLSLILALAPAIEFDEMSLTGSGRPISVVVNDSIQPEASLMYSNEELRRVFSDDHYLEV
jgi:hypothetical protein